MHLVGLLTMVLREVVYQFVGSCIGGSKQFLDISALFLHFLTDTFLDFSLLLSYISCSIDHLAR